MQAPLKSLMESLNGLQSTTPPISCVIYGCFFPWAHYAAGELGIPSVFFWTQSLAVFSIYYHASMLIANGFFPYKRIAPDGIQEESDFVSYIPGIPPLHPISFPGFLHVEDPSHPAFEIIQQQFATVKECKTIIFNSFHELEKEVYEALQAEPLSMYVVGPLLPSLHNYGHAKGIIEEEENLTRPPDIRDGITDLETLLEDKRGECLRWLDKQKKRSVLYISFGTIAVPSLEELEGIASGIKRIKQPYLWVLRQSSAYASVSEILPSNFLEETREHGKIVAWASQLEVLAHPAMGAFLTHCGWNSTLESLSMGVPLIPLPDKTDQPTNSKYVVDVWKVGMALKRNSNGKVQSSEVERVLGVVFHTEEGQEMRKRACQLRDAARRALEDENGPSILDICKFAQAVKRGPPFH